MLQQESMAQMDEQSKPRAALAARSSWLLLPYLAATPPGGVLQARAQLDSNGFISIDCGLAGSSYVDGTTKLLYNPDAAFTDSGENHNIPRHSPSGLAGSNYVKLLQDLRSFPNGKRNCYTLRSLTAGNKYLIRAFFMYGNYDGQSRPPIFDLHIGVNIWTTVDMDASNWRNQVREPEAIVVVPDDFVQVCLVNTGQGTPFISGLELRPLKSSLYPLVNATHGLITRFRKNFNNDTDIIVR